MAGVYLPALSNLHAIIATASACVLQVVQLGDPIYDIRSRIFALAFCQRIGVTMEHVCRSQSDILVHKPSSEQRLFLIHNSLQLYRHIIRALKGGKLSVRLEHLHSQTAESFFRLMRRKNGTLTHLSTCEFAASMLTARWLQFQRGAYVSPNDLPFGDLIEAEAIRLWNDGTVVGDHVLSMLNLPIPTSDEIDSILTAMAVEEDDDSDGDDDVSDGETADSDDLPRSVDVDRLAQLARTATDELDPKGLDVSHEINHADATLLLDGEGSEARAHDAAPGIVSGHHFAAARFDYATILDAWKHDWKTESLLDLCVGVIQLDIAVRASVTRALCHLFAAKRFFVHDKAFAQQALQHNPHDLVVRAVCIVACPPHGDVVMRYEKRRQREHDNSVSTLKQDLEATSRRISYEQTGLGSGAGVHGANLRGARFGASYSKKDTIILAKQASDGCCVGEWVTICCPNDEWVAARIVQISNSEQLLNQVPAASKGINVCMELFGIASDLVIDVTNAIITRPVAIQAILIRFIPESKNGHLHLPAHAAAASSAKAAKSYYGVDFRVANAKTCACIKAKSMNALCSTEQNLRCTVEYLKIVLRYNGKAFDSRCGKTELSAHVVELFRNNNLKEVPPGGCIDCVLQQQKDQATKAAGERSVASIVIKTTNHSKRTAKVAQAHRGRGRQVLKQAKLNERSAGTRLRLPNAASVAEVELLFADKIGLFTSYKAVQHAIMKSDMLDAVGPIIRKLDGWILLAACLELVHSLKLDGTIGILSSHECANIVPLHLTGTQRLWVGIVPSSRALPSINWMEKCDHFMYAVFDPAASHVMYGDWTGNPTSWNVDETALTAVLVALQVQNSITATREPRIVRQYMKATQSSVTCGILVFAFLEKVCQADVTKCIQEQLGNITVDVGMSNMESCQKRIVRKAIAYINRLPFEPMIALPV